MNNTSTLSAYQLDCYISPGSHMAVYKENGVYYLLKNSEDEAKEISEISISLMFRDWTDRQFFKLDSVKEIREELSKASIKHDLLIMASFTIDSDVSMKTRAKAALQANLMLKENTFAYQYLLNIFCSHPMPSGADLPGAVELCTQKRLTKLKNLIVELQKHEKPIEIMRICWNEISNALFSNETEKAAIQGELIKTGLFYGLIESTNQGIDPQPFMVEAVKALKSAIFEKANHKATE